MVYVPEESRMALTPKRSLRHQIVSITIISSTIAIIAAWGLMFGTELAALRKSVVVDLSVKADIVGKQCSAALLFDVRKDAEEILSSLRADPQIEYAAVLTDKGELFAQYWRSDIPLDGRYSYKLEEGHYFGLNRVALYQNVMLQGKRIGVVTIQSDQQRFKVLLLRYFGAAAIILTTSLLFVYVLASRLQSRITRPVSDLVHMMQLISDTRDYSLRAADVGLEELGSLARGFNEMLSTIQDRDQQLNAQRTDLERSVADLKRLAAELQEANRKLKTLDEMKSNFISVASHELRTPLTSIKAFIELMLMKPTMDGERKSKLLSVINAESDRLTRLVNDLLNLSRIEHGSMVWNIAKVSLTDIIQTVIDNLMPIAQERGLTLIASRPPMLPPVRGDHDRLQQVVTNLVSNALKFTARGGKIQVSVHLEYVPRPQIVVSVTDTGIGIPENDLEIIFDKFQRSDDLATSTIEGSGLGLAIAREIIEYHGGRIWAESINRKGSTFTFTLPISASDLA